MEDKPKTLEQELWESVSNSSFAEFSKYFSLNFIRTTYGLVITPFRIPTLFRRIRNENSLINKIDPTETPGEFEGTMGGIIMSLLVTGSAYILSGKEIVKELSNGNYAPLLYTVGALAVTNTLSRIFENRRKSK